MKQVKIKEIKKLNEKYDLYDIKTKNHNFYANDILVHNSNGSVCYTNSLGFWVQSRNNIITLENDNASCAFNAIKNKEQWIMIINSLAEYHNIDLYNNIVTVYFEWCGGNIQKNSALSGLDKRSIIFQHFKVSPLKQYDENDVTVPVVWKESKISDNEWVSNNDCDIYNIMNFPKWDIEIDFEMPEHAQNEMIRIVTEEIEPASPLGKTFGKEENIGEGMVITFHLLKVFKEDDTILINNKKPSIELEYELLSKLDDGTYFFTI